jgi:hypothetical protein
MSVLLFGACVGVGLSGKHMFLSRGYDCTDFIHLGRLKGWSALLCLLVYAGVQYT